jgi:uncharacterized protein (DUF58 family)
MAPRAGLAQPLTRTHERFSTFDVWVVCDSSQWTRRVVHPVDPDGARRFDQSTHRAASSSSIASNGTARTRSLP